MGMPNSNSRGYAQQLGASNPFGGGYAQPATNPYQTAFGGSMGLNQGAMGGPPNGLPTGGAPNQQSPLPPNGLPTGGPPNQQPMLPPNGLSGGPPNDLNGAPNGFRMGLFNYPGQGY